MKLLTTTALFTAMAVAPALAQTAQPGQAQDRAQPQAQTQNQNQNKQMQRGQAAELNFMQQQQAGQWSAEWLTNSNVYSAQDENIGTINDIIIGKDGRVVAVIIGVGGFLGIGQKDVALNFDALEMRPAPGATAATGRTGVGTPPPAQPGTQAQQPAAGQQRTTATAPATGQQKATGQQQAAAPAADRQQPAATGQQRTTATAPAADRQQRTVTGMGADNLRIYVNASREQLEAAPEYRLLESQEGGFFGGGSAQ